MSAAAVLERAGLLHRRELGSLALAAALGLSAAVGCSKEAENTSPGGVSAAGSGVGLAGTAAVPAAGSGGARAGAAAVAGRAAGAAGALATAGVPASGGSAALAGAGGATVSIGSAGASGATAGQAAAGSSGQAGSGLANAGSAGGLGGAGAGGQPAADGGGAGTGPSTSGSCTPWPTANGEQSVSASIKVSGHYDGGLKRFKGSGDLGTSDQSEDQGPIFDLAEGAVLENVIVGSPAADGIHCNGSCTLRNVWWEDVGEDAATFRASDASATMTVECAGAKKADDKILQHNGPGTMIVRQFYAEDFGKLYRSCGNCKTQYERHIELHDIDVKKCKSTLVGINTNYKDTATFDNITIHGDTKMETDICDRYTGNDSGDEPTKTGTGADGKSCVYSASDIHWLP